MKNKEKGTSCFKKQKLCALKKDQHLISNQENSWKNVAFFSR